MISRQTSFESAPLNIVGASDFGRDPKISTEKTINMFVSDGFLVDYNGYLSLTDETGAPLVLGKHGRAIFTSTILNRLIVVVDSKVYALSIVYSPSLHKSIVFDPNFLGALTTTASLVTIAENNAGQICICDQAFLWIYKPSVSSTITKVVFGMGEEFVPGYVTFHDTRFVATVLDSPEWRLSASNDGFTWPYDAQHVGALQRKGNNTTAVAHVPSHGNLIFVFGQTEAEPWFDSGYKLFPYTQDTSFNIDYGCLSPSTLAFMDEMMVWLAINERSGPIILVSTGGRPQKISTDGIDYLMSQFTDPADSSAFLIRQDGHLLYHINFYTDNISLFYDFNTKKFFHACDENGNYFIARSVAFINNQYYFVSNNNGKIYALDTIFGTYDGLMIPRSRTCKRVGFKDQDWRVINEIGFIVSQGIIDYDYTISYVNGSPVRVPVLPHIDLSISTDGGYTFGNQISYQLNPIGKIKNKLNWWNLGIANDLVCQFKFWGKGRFVAANGYVNVRK